MQRELIEVHKEWIPVMKGNLAKRCIAKYCFNISTLQLPFELNERRNIYKFFMRDTGLLSCMSLGNVQNSILNGDISINEGSITENSVADLVFKNGHKLHYYDIKGRLEIDFILNIENSVVPIEVKSGSDYKRHSIWQCFYKTIYHFSKMENLNLFEINCEKPWSFTPLPEDLYLL